MFNIYVILVHIIHIEYEFCCDTFIHASHDPMYFDHTFFLMSSVTLLSPPSVIIPLFVAVFVLDPIYKKSDIYLSESGLASLMSLQSV